MSSVSWKNEKIQIFTTIVDNLSFKEAKKQVEHLIEEEEFHRIYTPNTEIVMEAKKSKDLTKLVNSADLVVADGIGLVIGSKIKSHPLKERVTGFDLSMYILDYAEKHQKKIFLLGGAPGIAQKAKENLERTRPKLQIVGQHNGFFKGSHIGHVGHPEEIDVLEQIRASQADILFVGLGFPKQEIWIDKNKDKLGNIRLAIGNGGVIDILAGVAKRAPKIFIDLHLEWFYRLIKDPARIKRQVAIPKFLFEIVRDREAVKPVVREHKEEK